VQTKKRYGRELSAGYRFTSGFFMSIAVLMGVLAAKFWE
jgi:hypothetical protein